MKITAILFCTGLLMMSEAVSAEDPDRLFALIGKRLALMDEVAAHKWHRQLDIEDKKREQTVLDQASRTAMHAGVTKASSTAFFNAQIEAAKEIQRFWFARWQDATAGKPEPAPNLETVLRPRLIDLGDQIIRAIAATGRLDDSSRLRQQFNHVVSTEGLSAENRARLYEALVNIEFYPDRLDQILATGEIRIGTTGDYAPFSFRRDNELQGIDIDLGRDLAASLNVKPVFVRTSWPTLMQDLADNRFDVGMSGISRTLGRQESAFLSLPYHRGGKTPISRCEDVSKFDALDKIDSAQVRVIVNPGGTNQQFVHKHLAHADVRIFEDNRTIFDEIAEGRADVMITDAIEVTLKAREYPALCATLPEETFTYQEKAYLMPRDIALKEYVNTWISLRIEDGTVAEAFDKHLNPGTPR